MLEKIEFLSVVVGFFAISAYAFDREVDCRLPGQPGNCEGRFSRYYYDPKEARCLEMMFTGCGSNANKFYSENECMEACSGVLASRSDDEALFKNFDKNCELPEGDTGCYDDFGVLVLRYFYIPESQTCKSLYYCKSNWYEVGFEDPDSCNSRCPMLEPATEETPVTVPSQSRIQAIAGGQVDDSKYGKTNVNCGDLLSTENDVDSVESCKRFCSLNEGCKSLIHDKLASKCYLKKACLDSWTPLWYYQDAWIKLVMLQPVSDAEVTTTERPKTNSLNRFMKLDGYCPTSILTSLNGITDLETCANRCERYDGITVCESFTLYPYIDRCDLMTYCIIPTVKGGGVHTWKRMFIY